MFDPIGVAFDDEADAAAAWAAAWVDIRTATEPRKETTMFGMTTRDPFREMRALTRQMDRLMSQGAAGAVSGAGFPAMNVHAGTDGVAITAEMPGVAADALEISVHRDTVTLKGERKNKVEGAKGYHRRERGTGQFTRTLSLPFAVDPEQVEAQLADGMLRLSLRRPESDKPRRIGVQAA